VTFLEYYVIVNGEISEILLVPCSEGSVVYNISCPSMHILLAGDQMCIKKNPEIINTICRCFFTALEFVNFDLLYEGNRECRIRFCGVIQNQKKQICLLSLLIPAYII